MEIIPFQTGTSISANTETSFPSAYPEVSKIIDMVKFTGADGSASPTASTTNYSVVTGTTTPSSGEVKLSSPTSFECGDAINAYDLCVFVVKTVEDVEVDISQS